MLYFSFKDNAKLVAIIVKLNYLGVLISIVNTVVSTLHLSLFNQYMRGEVQIVELENFSAMFYMYIWLPTCTFAVIVGIFFIAWIYRVYKNLELICGDHLRYSSNSAVWGFIIPIVSFIKPYFVLREMYTVTREHLLRCEIVGEYKLPLLYVKLQYFSGLVLSMYFLKSVFFPSYIYSYSDLYYEVIVICTYGLVELLCVYSSIKVLTDYNNAEKRLKLWNDNAGV